MLPVLGVQGICRDQLGDAMTVCAITESLRCAKINRRFKSETGTEHRRTATFGFKSMPDCTLRKSADAELSFLTVTPS